MSIHRNPKGNGKGWVVRTRQGDRNLSKAFARKRDAELYEADTIRRRQLGPALDVTAGQIRLTPFFENVYWPGIANPRLADRTRAVYATVYACHIDPHLGGHRLRDLTPRVVDDWRMALEADGVGPRRSSRRWASCKGF